MTQLLHCDLDNGDTIYYSIVEKQSQRGFSSHRRLFLMLQNKFICYLSQPIYNFPKTYEHISRNAKTIVPLNQIKRLNFKNQTQELQIYFWIYEQSKRIEKRWLFKMGSHNMLFDWQCLFDEYTNRSRKDTIESRNIRANSESVQQIIRKQTPTRPLISPEEQQIQDKVAKQIAESSFLLHEPNQSFFAHYRLGDENSIGNYSSGKTNLHQLYFSRAEGYYSSFKNYYRPYLSDLFDSQISPSKQTHLEQIDKKFKDFIQYSTICVKTLIDSQLPQLIQTSLGKWNVNGRPSSYSGWIRYEEIEDLIIDFGLVQMRNIGNQTYVCDKEVAQIIEGIFLNMEFIYQVISEDQPLRRMFTVPMTCMVSYKGHQCLVRTKIDPKTDQQFDIGGDLSYSKIQLFERLATLTKVQLSHLQNEQNVIFIARNKRKDRFAITQVRQLLPQLQDGSLLPKQSVNSIFGLCDRRVDSSRRHQRDKQNNQIAEFLQGKIEQLCDLMNKLEVYPISPQEMNYILSSFGLYPSLLGRLVKCVTQPFAQTLLKTEVAMRSFAPVFVKKMQQTLSKPDQCKYIESICLQLLNALLGKGDDHNQIWRLVKLHSQTYFGISVEPQDINKGYFFMGLDYQLNLQLFPASYNIEHIFKIERFLQGIKFVTKIQAPNILPFWVRKLQQQHEIPISANYFAHLVSNFNLEQKKLPFFLSIHNHLRQKVILLISYFVKPRDNKFQHLELYKPISDCTNITRYYLQSKMTELRWEIKEQVDKEYVLILINRLREHIINHYGLSHPFISQILDFQSLYCLQRGQYEQAITINQESLGNILQCCGNNQQQLKLSNSHFHFSQCLQKCHRQGEALIHLRKAKHILQVNSYKKRPQYAYLLFKIGKIYLLQNKDNESYQYLVIALKIYQSYNLELHWDRIVDIYQAISRCQVNFHGQTLKGLRLAEQCLFMLSKVIEGQECSNYQFIRAFKIIIEEYLRRIPYGDSTILREYLIQLADQLAIESDANHNPDQLTYIGINYFKQKIIDGIFLSDLQNYLMGSGQILNRMKHENKMKVFRGGDSVDNFDKFMRRLMVVAGQWFILNTIK